MGKSTKVEKISSIGISYENQFSQAGADIRIDSDCLGSAGREGKYLVE